jgi:hypothetical protein
MTQLQRELDALRDNVRRLAASAQSSVNFSRSDLPNEAGREP